MRFSSRLSRDSYVLDGPIMDMRKTIQPPDGVGEIQMTDTIAVLIGTIGVDDAFRYDCGSKMGNVEATLVHALHHLGYGPKVRALITKEAQAD